jgi:hypothetical protein
MIHPIKHFIRGNSTMRETWGNFISDLQHLRDEEQRQAISNIASRDDKRSILDNLRATHVAEGNDACAAIRDVIGNPFRRPVVDPDWLRWNDSTVQRIATSITDGNAFDRMPILADALEDAGCNSVEILQHCRETRLHVRGCWMLELLRQVA